MSDWSTISCADRPAAIIDPQSADPEQNEIAAGSTPASSSARATPQSATQGSYIAYSTGNFAGYHTFSTAGPLGMSAILRVTLDGHGTPMSGRWQSVRIVGAGTPQIDPSGASAALAAQMSREDFGASAVPPGPDGALPLDG